MIWSCDITNKKWKIFHPISSETFNLLAACWSPWTRPSHMEEGYGSRNSSCKIDFINIAVWCQLKLLVNGWSSSFVHYHYITWAVQWSSWTLHKADSSLAEGLGQPPYLGNCCQYWVRLVNIDQQRSALVKLVENVLSSRKTIKLFHFCLNFTFHWWCGSPKSR